MSKRRTLQGPRAFVTEPLRYGATQRVSMCRWEPLGRSGADSGEARRARPRPGPASTPAGPALPRPSGGARGLYDLVEEREDGFELERLSEVGRAGGLGKS